ncbi:MAG: tetratricopeptide repeat protein [Alphaproteobacteria bacterium]|nr:tetratricopeptide repeat protein [Alphaproteobacteria bacterium]
MGGFRLQHITVAAITAVMFAGCSLISKEAVPNAGLIPKTADAQTNPERQFNRALELLQIGKAEEADAELHNYLEAAPKSRAAKFLIQQIEAPIATLFPSENFRVRIPRGGSLSGFARTYLGNSLAFYGLARYNGIEAPADVHEGQWLRIPKTQSALAARRAAAVLQSPSRPVEAEPPLLLGCLPGRSCSPFSTPEEMLASPQPSEQRNEPTAPEQPSGGHAVAERHYHLGLLAFQKQDLDGAIDAWNKALAADPGFLDARVRLLEAERLRRNLRKLRN